MHRYGRDEGTDAMSFLADFQQSVAGAYTLERELCGARLPRGRDCAWTHGQDSTPGTRDCRPPCVRSAARKRSDIAAVGPVVVWHDAGYIDCSLPAEV